MATNIWKNLEIKIMLILLLVIVSLATGIYSVMFNQYHSLSITQLQENAASIHKFAEEVIDEQSFFVLNTPEDEDSEIYINAHIRLDEIRRIANIEYLYTSKLNENGEPIYVIDGLSKDDEHFRHVGDLIEDYFSPTILSSLESDEPTFGDEIIVSEWGYLYMACFPFHDAEQNVIGVIVMEFDCESLYSAIHSTRVTTIVLSGILACIFIILAFMIIRKVIKKAETIQTDTSDKLESALIQANAASKAKGDFLSTMSHEMRTPMNAIIGMTAIGRKTDDIEEKNYTLNKIGDASTHLLGVINDILDMAKIEADKLELTLAPYHLEKMLKRVITVIQFRADEKQQKLTLNIDEKIPRYIVGDSQRLAQALTNLLSNAVKFAHEGGNISLNASLSGETDGHCELRFEIIDDGIGMSPDQQEKIFDAFEQGDGETGRLYGGTGLGLAITKRIIDLMDGEIWVESEVDKGTVFTFTIQAARDSENEGERDTEADNGDGPGAAPDGGMFKGKRLLIAEDIEINREILVALLGDTGLVIDCVETGAEALEVITAGPDKYDIVFMDLQMPKMSGLEATRLIRALPSPQCKKLPIIAMTAHIFMDDIEECLAAGMDDHVGKPLDIEKIMEVLRKFLG